MTNNRFSAGGPEGVSVHHPGLRLSLQVQPRQRVTLCRREHPGLPPSRGLPVARAAEGWRIPVHQPVIASRNWAAVHPAGTRFRVFPMAGFGRDRTTRPIP